MATIEEFQNIEMKIGKIISAERIPDADKLLRLMVDFGPKTTPAIELNGQSRTQEDQPGSEGKYPPEERDVRQILSGIAQWYAPEALVGKFCPFVTNLPTRKLRGLESHGMILAVGVGDSAVLLHPDKEVAEGSKLR